MQIIYSTLLYQSWEHTVIYSPEFKSFIHLSRAARIFSCPLNPPIKFLNPTQIAGPWGPAPLKLALCGGQHP